MKDEGCRRQAVVSGQWAVDSKTLQEADPFILHPSSFILHPSSFILHPSSLFLAVVLTAVLAPQSGCRRPSPSPNPVGSEGPEAEHMRRSEVFNYAVGTLFNYVEYDSAEVLQQAVGRLDQWVQAQEPLADWKLDPLVATLPNPLSELPAMLKPEQLEFPRSDALAFRETVWLRDVSTWARGDAVDELDQARELFDWTARNVQLDGVPAAEGTQAPSRVLQKPWETLLFGRGTATDRAWLFILLARQQGIDAALLALVDPDDTARARLRPWVVAVLSQGELYLFDPTLGMPIPAPGGVTRGPAGALDLRPATLAQVAQSDALLRQLDVEEYRYPVESSQVQSVVVLLEASPTYLAQRMKLVENQLASGERLVLTTDPSGQAKQFQACRHVVDVRLWALPYQTLVQERQLGPNRQQWQQAQLLPFMAATGSFPALWKVRQYHLKGIFTGEQSAASYYQTARPPERLLNTAPLDPGLKQTLARAKLDASYWLGLIAAQQGNHEAAVDWLATRTLEAAPDGPWTWGARYNLGRVYEALGRG